MMYIKYLLFFILAFIVLGCTNLSKEDTKKANKNELIKIKDSEPTKGLIDPEKVKSTKSKSKTTEFGERISIKFSPYIPNYDSFSKEQKKLLTSRLNSAIANVGYGGEESNPRFIVGTAVNILSKELTATAPSKYAVTYEINFLSADFIEKTVFSSYTIEFKGIGESMTKAFVNGFRNFELKNKEFYNFLKEAEQKISNYYKENCKNFIALAKSEIELRNFQAAYNILDNIPMEANECFENAIKLRKEVFNALLQENCNELLMKMKAELGKMNDKTASGFNEEAMAYYKLIDPESECYSEAERIYNDYIEDLEPEQRRNWKQKMKEVDWHKDSLTMVKEYKKEIKEMETKARIEGHKRLLEKYKKDYAYNKQPWLRRLFHLGKYDPFDGYSGRQIH